MRTLLVPIDFSDATPRVLDVAERMAAAFDARIVLLHVASPEPDFVGFDAGPQSVRNDLARDIKVEHKELDVLRDDLAGRGCETQALLIQGPTAEKILEEAGKQRADTIVIGSHGHGALYELFVGSTVQDVLKGAVCPVLVVPVRKN